MEVNGVNNGAGGSGGASEQDLISSARQNVAELNKQQILAGELQKEFAKAQIMRGVVQSSAQR